MSVTDAIRVGDPATCIVERAHSLNADLVVGDSRRRGTLATTLLGSVSAADVAGEALSRWPLLDFAQITIGCVIELHVPAAMGAYGHVPSMGFEYEDAPPASARERASEVIGRRMRELRAPGRRVFGRIREGDAADELLRLARSDGCDLIVVGASRKGPLTELLLGGVVHSLVRRFEGSVLVARPSHGGDFNQIKPAPGSR